jgi:hypothetical protein
VTREALAAKTERELNDAEATWSASGMSTFKPATGVPGQGLPQPLIGMDSHGIAAQTEFLASY